MTSTQLSPTSAPVVEGRSRAWRSRSVAVELLDHAGAVTLAGGLAGLVALGMGSRAAMRIVALTSGRIGTGVRPDSGATPGEITLSGTAFLLLAGLFLGAVIGLAAAGGLGRWFPGASRRRWLAVACLAAVLPALGLLDPANVDFQLFGPRWLAVGLFLALPLAYGALVASLAPRLLARRGGRVARAMRVVLGIGGVGLLLLTMGAGAREQWWMWPILVLVVVGLARPSDADDSTATARAGRVAVAALAVASVGVIAWRTMAVVAA